MIDLIDMTRYKKINDGFCWVLTIIDVYSKFAWAFPLKSKSGEEVTKNLEFLFYKLTGYPRFFRAIIGRNSIIPI
jgi:transposase InsO family protein